MSKAHKLPRLSKSLLETPQLITEAKFREIAEVLDNRELLKSYQEGMFLSDDDDKEYMSSNLDGQSIGVLEVEGPLTYKPTGWEALCGGCSYVSLIEQMEGFAKAGVKTVLMQINSGGGMAYRMSFTSSKLRQIADDNDIRLIGYVDGMAASAALGLGVACHELIANPESDVGSVGVVVSLINDSEKLKKEGINRQFITAGKEKVPFDKEGAFKDEFLSDIQDKVDTLYEKFTTHVATMRSMNVQDVIDTEAKVFKADKALEIGFIDKIMEEDEFLEYLGASWDKEDKEENSPSGVEKQQKDNEEISMSKEDLSTPVVDTQENADVMNVDAQAADDLQAQLAAMQAELESYKTKEISAKKDSLEKELSQHAFLANTQEALVGFLMGDAEQATKDLVNSIVSDAALEVNSLTEKLEQQEKAFEEAAEKLSQDHNAEIEKLKTEFGEEVGMDTTVDLPMNADAEAKESVAKLLAKKYNKAQ